MSKPVKTDETQTPALTDLPFEAALDKLDAIVHAMENDELPLEKLLAQYEEGTKLYQQCQARLSAAETRIQQIEKDAAGRLTAKRLDLPPSADKP